MTFDKHDLLGICEVWTYSFKNYAPISTITYKFSSGIDSDSHELDTAGLGFLAYGQKMSGAEKAHDFYKNRNMHTCTFITNASPSVYLFTLPYYLVIKNLYLQGDTDEMWVYLGDPLSPAISSSTASSLNTAVIGASGKYSNHPNLKNVAKLTKIED